MAHAPEAAAARRLHDPVGTLVAGLFVVLGVVMIASTGSMTPLGSVFPITISAAMIVFSLVLIARNVIIGTRAARASAGARDQDTQETLAVEDAAQTGGSMARRVLLLVAMAAWVFLIPVLGFFVATFLGFFTIMAIATHEKTPLRELAVLFVIGVVILTAFYLLMANVLLIPMPTGLFF